MPSSRTLRSPLLVAALTLAGLAVPALACPLCSEEAEQQQEETGVNVAMGYSVSVLLMIAVPMSMVGGLGYALYRNQQQIASSEAQPKRTDVRD